MIKLYRKLIDFVRNESGLAFMEFAISVPILMILFFGMVDISRYVMIFQRMDRAASVVSDIITNSASASDAASANAFSAELPNILALAQRIVQPYSLGTNGKVIISNIKVIGGTPRLVWQRCDGGALSVSSRLGNVTGGTVALPSGFTLGTNDEIVITEIFYDYKPLTYGNLVQNILLYSQSINSPRLPSATYGSYVSSCGT